MDRGAGRIADIRQATDVPPAPRAMIVFHGVRDGARAAWPSHGGSVAVRVRRQGGGRGDTAWFCPRIRGSAGVGEARGRGGITDVLSDAFGAGLGRASVQDAPAAADGAPEPKGAGSRNCWVGFRTSRPTRRGRT